MKQINLTLLALLIGISTGFAQITKTEFVMSIPDIRVVVLDLTGNTNIQTSPKDEIKIISFLQSKGATWGWKWPNQRPDFKIMERVSKDTLYITSPFMYSPNTIGISTYSENINNAIFVPECKYIYVIHSDQLKVEDGLEKLDVINTEELTVSIRKSTIKQLKCNSHFRLKINAIESTKSYELNGLGTRTYNLEANQINMNLK